MDSRPEPIEFGAADVRRYYDKHTDHFVTHGSGGHVGALHRAVWGPGVTTSSDAFRYVEDQLLGRLSDLDAATDRMHVVDLGCGIGASLCYLASRLSMTGTGLTLSPVQVSHATQRIRDAGLHDRVRCLEADYCDLPNNVTTADLVYAIESFVHSPDPSRFFAACARLLRNGGLLAICDDVRRQTGARGASRVVEQFRRGWHLNTLLSADELRSHAREAGFEHLDTVDLTSHLRLGRPRDRFAATFVTLCGWLPLRHTRFEHLVGGTALQRCLKRGWIGYELAWFRKR